MYQKTVEYFKLLQESATTFADNLKDGALQEQIAFEEGIEEFSKMVEEIQDPVEKDLGERKLILLGIKEDMINYLDQSREFMETHITRNEKDI
jgi:ATP-dependent Zn protease